MPQASHASAEHKPAKPAHSPPSPVAHLQTDAPLGALIAGGQPDLAPDAPGGPTAAADAAWHGKAEARHAALLTDARLAAPVSHAQRVRLLQRMQHGFGNSHVARVVQRVADCPAPPVEKPKLEPTHDPKFQQVQGKVKQVAKEEKQHQPAKAKVNEAQAAAEPPANDSSSQAAATQVDKMGAQKPGGFDKAAFVAAVKKAIEAASPKTMQEADEYQQSGKAAQVKDQVGGMVTRGKEDSQKAIKETTQAPPDASSATPKPVTAMKEETSGKPPTDVGAARGLPDKKAPEEINLAAGPCELNAQMADAKVTDEQLKNSNEPQFQDTLDAKKKTEEQAAKAPAEYRAKEQETLDAQKADAAKTASSTLAGMHQAKGAAAGKVGGDKGGAKAKDEAARARVAKEIEDIYKTTKDEVTKILGDLDPLVDKTFKEGEEQARNEFTSYVKTKTDEFKDKRYGGVGGWTLWLADKLTSPPKELNDFIDQGRAKYIAKMDSVISNVADVIGHELTRAKERIDKGRGDVKKKVDEQPKELKQAALEAQGKIESQFDQLESDVNDKQDSLVQNLAEKYTTARDALDEEANKMKEENKGLLDMAKDAVKNTVETILKMKDMLLGVLSKAAGVIDKIIADPIKFLGNLANAIKQGLNQFVGNIATHLKKGLMGWLFGALGDAGITMPESFDLKGILSLILQVLGLTYDNIRGIAVRIAGEKVVSAIEKTVKFFIVLAQEGPAGLWNFIKEKIAEINIKEMVLGAIKDFVITKIITAGVTWLIGLLNPAAAFVKACKMIYDVIMFFIERGAQIMEFVNSVLDGLGAIADGAIGSAANLVEGSLAKILPLAISFLASLLGVGGIAEKIKEIIEKIRAPITKLVTAVLGPLLKPLKKLYDKGAKFVKGLVDKGKALGKKAIAKAKNLAKKGVDKVKGKVKGLLGGKEETDDKKKERLHKGVTAGKSAVERLSGRKIGDRLVRPALATVRMRYRLGLLEPIIQNGRWAVHGELQRETAETSKEAGAAGASDLKEGQYLGLKVSVGRQGRRTSESGGVVGDQWKPLLVMTVTADEVTLKDVRSGSTNKYPLSAVESDINGSMARFKRISGPEELADKGVYVEGGMLKPEYRGPGKIRGLFYTGDYGAEADTLLGTAKAKARQSPLFKSGKPGGEEWGSEAWLCPGFARSAHIVEGPAHVDHKLSVAEHWSLLQGNNTNQKTRGQWNVQKSNLELLCGPCNLSKGSMGSSGKRSFYTHSVGEQFTGPDDKR